MTTRQTPDAVRECENDTSIAPVNLRQALEAVAAAMLNGGDGAVGDFGWNITKLNRARPLIRAALDSRAGDAGEGLSDDAPTPADALAMIEQEISFWPEGSRARTAATRCRNIVRAMICALSATPTPAPAVDAVPDGEDQAARDRRMYDQGRLDERAGEPEAFQ